MAKKNLHKILSQRGFKINSYIEKDYSISSEKFKALKKDYILVSGELVRGNIPLSNKKFIEAYGKDISHFNVFYVKK